MQFLDPEVIHMENLARLKRVKTFPLVEVIETKIVSGIAHILKCFFSPATQQLQFNIKGAAVFYRH